MNIVNSALGHYEVLGQAAEAEVVIGHSFGTATSEGSVNAAITRLILENSSNRPIIVDRMLVDPLGLGEEELALVVDGPISNTVGQGVGTWGVLEAVQSYMREREMQAALMIAHASHIGRVVMQAEKLGIRSITLPGMPTHFDKDSDQLFTRHPALWVPREVLGSFVLRTQDKL